MSAAVHARWGETWYPATIRDDTGTGSVWVTFARCEGAPKGLKLMRATEWRPITLANAGTPEGVGG